jgi:uncharacterized protein (DUF362 family)
MKRLQDYEVVRMPTRVSLCLTRSRDDGVRFTIGLLGINPVKGKNVVLKPNFNSADLCPGSTHIDTLRSLILALKDMEARSITLAERSGPGDATRVVMEKKGVLALARELGFAIVNLEEMAPHGWMKYVPEHSHWSDGFMFPVIYNQAECVVSTCCLKTHQFGGHFSLSLKLAVGLVPRADQPYMQEMHRSPHQRQMIAEINAAYTPSLIVLDGVDAFVDGGPARGTRVEAGVMLGGTDRVAIDAVGVSILRLLGTTPEVSRGPVFKQDQIARAVELGLGVTSPLEIEIVTPDPKSAAYAEKVRQILIKE